MSNSVTVTVQYTKDQQDKLFIETGKRIDHEKRELSIDDMTIEQRTDLLTINWTGGNFGPGSSVHLYRLSEEFRTKKPCVGTGDIVYFDSVPTDEELLKLMSELAEEKRAMMTKVAELLPAWREADAIRKAEEEEQRIKRAARDEEREQRRDKEREQKRIETVTINWENGTALFDLHNGLCIASGLSYDHRWQSWVKEITGIDRDKKNGYMYEGSFVNEGTVELDENEHRVFLVASETGSNKYRTMFYQVVELVDGKLVQREELFDDDDKPGWALRMRGGIADLLQAIEPVAATITITTELAQRILVALSLNDQSLADELNLQIK